MSVCQCNDDEQSADESRARASEIQEIEALQPLQNAAEDTNWKTRGNRGAHYEEKPTGCGHKIEWDLGENRVYVVGGEQRDAQGRNSDGAIAEHSRIYQSVQFGVVLGSGKLGDVANNGRTNAEVEQPVIAGNRKDQDPESVGVVPKAMKDERGEKDSDHNIQTQREPGGSDVSQDLAFIELHEPCRNC